MATKVINTILQMNASGMLSGLQQVGKETQTLTGSFQKMATKGNKSFSSLATTSINKLSTWSGNVLKICGGGIAAVVGYSTSVGQAFDSAMSEVEALSGASGDDLTALSDAAREAGENTIFTATESAEAMKYMALAGWDTSEMLDGLDGVLNLAAASDMDLASASDIVTDYLTAFGLSASDSTQFVDQLAYAMSSSNTSTEQLGEAYKNCAATATQLGYGVEETTATLMVMADAGIKGGEAGTALSSIMTRLGNNTSNCADLLSEYGIEVYDAEGNTNSLTDILGGMKEVWGDLSDEQKANLAYTVAGKTAQSELMTVLGESTGSFEEYMEGLQDCDGAAQNMADTMNDNFAGSIELLKSKIESMGVTFWEDYLSEPLKGAVDDLLETLNSLDFEPLMEAISGLLTGGMDALSKALEWVAENGDTVIAVLPKVVAAIAGIKGATTAVKTVSSLVSGFKLLSPVAKGVFGVISAGSPVVTALRLAMILLPPIILLIVTNWKKVTTAFNNFIANHPQITAALDTVKGAINTVRKTAVNLANRVIDMKDRFVEFVSTNPTITAAFGAIKSAVQKVVTFVKNLRTGVKNLIDKFNDFLSNHQGIVDGFNAIKDAVSGVVTFVGDLIDKIKSAVDWFGNLFSAASDADTATSSSSYAIEGNASGTPYFGGGWTKINERGGEIAYLPGGTQIVPHDKSIAAASGGGGATINLSVTVAGNVIGNDAYADELGEHIVRKLEEVYA